MAPDSDYIPRYVDLALDLLLAELPALMLTGPRGCGKTTTAVQRVESVLRLDRPDEARAFRAAPDALLAAQTPPVLIDEWQAVPESMGAVKRSVDSHPTAGRFLLTGSVRARLDSAGWPATGRVTPLGMYGLTVAEIERQRLDASALDLLFGEQDPIVATLGSAPTLVDYLDHAVRGGFPNAIDLTDFGRSAWYEGYVDQLIRHDVAALAEIRSSTGLHGLLHAVALNTAGLPALTTLAAASGLDHRTAKTYLAVLEDLRIIERVPAWTLNRMGRLVKTPKYHVLDPGLAAHLAGDTRPSLLKSNDRLGRLIDTFVFAQIRPLLSLTAPAVRAFHLRDGNQQREVDLILESAAGSVVGIEVKAADSVQTRDARHLSWLRDRLGDDFHRGIVFYSGANSYPLTEKIWAMPIARLWRS
jgi:predicted AAA+ superfamily ATPase